MALQLLAVTVTEGCKLRALDIAWNCYTPSGLTYIFPDFSESILSYQEHMSCPPDHTHLIVLSTGEVQEEYGSLVDKFNVK